MAGIRQDTLCILVSVCFHNLVTYAQRLQDLSLLSHPKDRVTSPQKFERLI
jgi:hypothetical protein